MKNPSCHGVRLFIAFFVAWRVKSGKVSKIAKQIANAARFEEGHVFL